MTICGVANCDAGAVANVYWPGKPPMPMCQGCVSCAEHIGSIMSFHLPTEPLEGFVKLVIDEGGATVVDQGGRGQ